MKKLLLFIIGGLLWQSDGFGQSGSYGQHSFYSSYSQLNIYQNDLPSGFLFLVDDNFQKVLTNPAKSFLFDQTYVGTTVSGGSQRPVSAAVILPGKWLVTASYFNSTDGYTSNSHFTSSTNVSYTQSGYLFNESEYERRIQEEQNDRAFNSAELRVIRTWKNGDHSGRAIGFFLGFTQQDNDIESIYDRYRDTFFGRERNDTLVQNSFGNSSFYRRTIRKDKTNLLKGGIEYYRASEKGESFHKIYAHLTDFDEEESIYTDLKDTTRNIYPSISSNRVDIKDEEDRAITDAVPIGLSYQGYMNRVMNWLGEDHLFLNVEGRFSRGDLNFNQRTLDRIMIYQNGTEVLNTANSVSYISIGNESRLWYGSISAGYAIQKAGEGYSLFSGFSPYYNLLRVDDYNLNTGDILHDSKYIYYEAGFNLPAYGSFALNEQFNLWGGTNVKYTFLVSKEEQLFIEKIDQADQSVPNDQSFKSRTKDNRIDQFVFFGLNYQHKSGLQIATNFRGDLSKVNNWLISVGYEFD